MKFLCVPCDKPMTMMSVSPPDRGSLSVVYGCPDCGYEMAMLTNAFETQLVSSLGVKIGPSGETTSKCPFAGMMASPEPQGVRWTPEAEERMASVPDFVRPMAKSGIEKFAEEAGYAVIDAKVLDEAKSRFGM